MTSIAGSLFALSQLESMKKNMEVEKQLEEITIEDREKGVEVQEQSTAKGAEAESKKKSRVGRAKKSDI